MENQPTPTPVQPDQSPQITETVPAPTPPIPLPATEPQAPSPAPAVVQTNPGIESAVVSSSLATEPKTSAGILILQWLTYAFWGWTVLSLSLLTSLVITSAMKASSFDSFTPYAIAAVLVLLPISVICDFLYLKHESSHKSGPAMVIMVIHAVIFALFAIGSMIAVAFSAVQLGTSSSDSSGTTSMLFTSLIIAVIYGLTFLRTLSPAPIMWFRKVYIAIMVLVVSVMAILGFVGPVSQASVTKDDKLIEQSLPSIQSSISNYAQLNHGLPANLLSLRLDPDSKLLVDRNLVTYKPNSIPATNGGPNMYSSAPSPSANNGDKTVYYQLCVKYKKEDSSKALPYGNDAADAQGYSTYLSATGHPAGDVCYKIKEDIFIN